MRSTITLLFSLLLFASSLSAAGQSDMQRLMTTTANGGKARVIVTLNNDALSRIESIENLSDAARMSVVARAQDGLMTALSGLNVRPVQRFSYTPAISMLVDRSVLQTLAAHPLVKSVQENRLSRPNLAQSVPRVFSNQVSSPYTGNNEWAVAVIDTGVDKNHGFLRTGATAKVISEACYSEGGGEDGFTETKTVCPGGAYATTAPGSGVPCSVSDCNHGTHVAGIAAGDGSSFDGVARLGKIIALQTFTRIDDFLFCAPQTSCTGAFSSDIILALERVFALRNTFKIAAVNMSLGGSALFRGACNTDPRKPIIDMLRAAGIATVVASGNAGSSTGISPPACISSAIAVGSSLDNADVRSSFSNNSPQLDLYAPGSNITSSVPGNRFAVFNGTSMATPHVAGAFAVLKHKKPTATVNELLAILKANGPGITHNGITRTRIDVTRSLAAIPGVTPLNPVNMVPIVDLILSQ